MKNDKVIFEHGYALFIGIKYEHWANNIAPLAGALRDVISLNTHFTHPEKAAYNPENVITLSEEKATADGILNALDAIQIKAGKDTEATVIIYYAGHGETDGKDYFLVPYNFDLKKWQQENKYDTEKVVLAQQFAKKISNIKAKKSLVILDCCHSENIPVTRGLIGENDFLDGFLNLLDSGLNDGTNTRSLSDQLKKGNGNIILTSCKATEESLDLGRNGLFTEVLLECLNGKDNIENDGWVRLIDLMKYVPDEVTRRAKEFKTKGKPHSQHPVFKRIENVGSKDFIISAYNITRAITSKKDWDRKVQIEQTNQKKGKMIDKNKILVLINEDIEEAFDLLDELLLKSNGTYNDLNREYTNRPNNFDMATFRSKLRRFVKRKL